MYKEIFNDFKDIMRDKKERKEFLGGFACVLVAMAECYFAILIFH
jgi:hypothetical protein